MVVSGPMAGAVWKVGGSLLTVLLLATGTAQTVSQLGHEQRTVVRELAAAGIDAVDVDSDQGPIRVVGGAPDRIRVTAVVSDGLERTEHSQEVDGDRLRLRGRCPGFLSNHCEVRWTVEVPPEVDVHVRTESRVTLADLDGSVDVDTRGPIEATGLGGPARLRSGYEGVTATDLASAEVEVLAGQSAVLGFREPPTAVDATSRRSHVEVVLPDDGSPYRVDATSDRGTTLISTLRIDPDSERSIVMRGAGDATARYR